MRGDSPLLYSSVEELPFWMHDWTRKVAISNSGFLFRCARNLTPEAPSLSLPKINICKGYDSSPTLSSHLTFLSRWIILSLKRDDTVHNFDLPDRQSIHAWMQPFFFLRKRYRYLLNSILVPLCLLTRVNLCNFTWHRVYDVAGCTISIFSQCNH